MPTMSLPPVKQDIREEEGTIKFAGCLEPSCA